VSLGQEVKSRGQDSDSNQLLTSEDSYLNVKQYELISFYNTDVFEI